MPSLFGASAAHGCARRYLCGLDCNLSQLCKDEMQSVGALTATFGPSDHGGKFSAYQPFVAYYHCPSGKVLSQSF